MQIPETKNDVGTRMKNHHEDRDEYKHRYKIQLIWKFAIKMNEFVTIYIRLHGILCPYIL